MAITKRFFIAEEKKTSVGWHVDMRGVTWSTTGQSEGFTTCHHCTICCLGQNWTRFAASTTKIRGQGRVSNILTGKEVEITALCSKCFGYWEIITCFNSSVLSLLFEISMMGTQCQFEDISIYCKWSSEMNSSKEFWHIKMYFNVKNSPAIKSEKPISSKQCSSIWKYRVNFLKPKGLGRVLEKSFEALHASLEKLSDNYYVKDGYRKMSIAHPMLNTYSVMYWTLSQSHYVYVATNKSRSKKGLHNSFNFLEIWYNFLGCLHRFITFFTFSWHRQTTW